MPKGRRLREALGEVADMREWCEERGVGLKVSQDGHHWRYTFAVKVGESDGESGEVGEVGESELRIAEWWPSSARLVFGKRYGEYMDARDCGQVQRALVRRWKL
jgi:hypothetical protein